MLASQSASRSSSAGAIRGSECPPRVPPLVPPHRYERPTRRLPTDPRRPPPRVRVTTRGATGHPVTPGMVPSEPPIWLAVMLLALDVLRSPRGGRRRHNLASGPQPPSCAAGEQGCVYGVDRSPGLGTSLPSRAFHVAITARTQGFHQRRTRDLHPAWETDAVPMSQTGCSMNLPLRPGHANAGPGHA
jgi:hypothetical protein